MMTQPKKLIEVAMPIKEISAESIRDKSIRHGHISTLHLWWARRPLPVCRAVVFASLIPDPLDPYCPKVFKDSVEILLGEKNNVSDPYKPYEDIPYTAVIDQMEDNLRNRLLMFIGKFSHKFITNEKYGRKTDGKDQLSDSSLIKWENKNNETIINKARKLIWVANNCHNSQNAEVLLKDFERCVENIQKAENILYITQDRHKLNPDNPKELALDQAIKDFLKKMPKILDPFAGGGAIPLEASRLGCQSYGNDINPVAYIIQKGSLEYPQKYGKPIVYSKEEFIARYTIEEFNLLDNTNKVVIEGETIAVRISNRLLFDINFFGKKLLSETEKEIKYLYPDKNGKRPLVYYWARTGICSNPSCNSEIPLLKQFYLSKRRTASEKDYIYLNPLYKDKVVLFEIKTGKCEIEPFNRRTDLVCPICGSLTDSKTLKSQFINGKSSIRLLAVIEEDNNFKRKYRLPYQNEIDITRSIKTVDIPQDSMQIGNNRNFNTPNWGISKFGEMFTNRQLTVLHTLIKKLSEFKCQNIEPNLEYWNCIVLYLSILIDRIAARNTSLGVWHILQETVEHPFGRQAIPMVFDFPEMYPFSDLSGGAYGQLESILNYISSESLNFNHSICLNSASGDKNQFPEKFLSATITDPPYYDAIAYADLSDFFYVWLKRSIGDVFPLNFATPQTPKTEECTALKHHHGNNIELAKKHFENKLLQIFSTIEHQTSDIVSIMFAHQSTEAWTTLCNSILGSKMNITGSWANDTEVTIALKNDMSVLSSSVTVSCRPIKQSGIANFKTIKDAIKHTVEKEVLELYKLGFRGIDLLTACFGQAVSEFGKYECVEKADGSAVSITELLELAKENAFDALLKGFDGDDYTKFYIGWLQLFGFSESDFDDAAKFARVGLNIDVGELFGHHILIKKGNKQELGNYKSRSLLIKKIGDSDRTCLIDLVHKAMILYEKSDRNSLVEYLAKVDSVSESPFWRVVTSLCEVLPQGSDDYKQASGLLLNKDSLIRESKNIQRTSQGQLF